LMIATHGPAWSEALRSAHAECFVHPDSTVSIPITPAPEFSVTLRCDRLDP